MNFEAVIGLETHIELKTKSKMFSNAPVGFGAKPNTLIVPIDLAFPGTMPSVNKQAVINAIRVSNALHMEIDHELHFDRKNYFYSDLPKGYQITQNERPIGKNGYLDVVVNEKIKRVNIERLHIEEDTCKQLHFQDFTLLDYNRAGTPLVEVVTTPSIRSGEEAMLYVEMLQKIVQYLDVSDGKMEEGSLRCDVNISLRPIGSETLGTKVEIKNLNSVANVKRAIDFEVMRQAKMLLKGERVIQETRRFDESKKETILMRVKTDAVDYKYFPEPNITPIKLSDEFIMSAIDTSNELASARFARYTEKYNLSSYDANVLLQSKDISDYFDACAKECENYKLLSNFLTVEIMSYLNKKQIGINKLGISPKHLGELISLLSNGKIVNKQAREILNKMIEKDASPNDYMKEIGGDLINDEETIRNMVIDVISNNPQSVFDYKSGKDRAVGFLIGQIMKKTQGKVNPALTNALVLEELKRR